MVAKNYKMQGNKIILTTPLGTIGIAKERVDRIEKDVEVRGPYPGQAGFGKIANKTSDTTQADAPDEQKLLQQQAQFAQLKRRVDISHGSRKQELEKLIADLRSFRQQLLQNKQAHAKEFKQVIVMEQQVINILAKR